MEDWTDKNFRVLDKIRQEFDALGLKKGKQMWAASAALLWYIQASVEERVAFESRVHEIQAGLREIGEPVTKEQAQDYVRGHVELVRRVCALERLLAEQGPAGASTRRSGGGSRATKQDAAEQAERDAAKTRSSRQRRKGSQGDQGG